MVRWKTVKQLVFPSPLTQSEIIALGTLAKEEPTNPYQIAKKAKKSYSLMFKSVKKLEKRGMVKFEGKERTEKGTTANIYDLALKGVLFVLKKEFESFYTDKWNTQAYNFTHKIIRKYGSLLPLVFGKWSHFKKMGVEKMAFRRLKWIVDNPHLFNRGTSMVPGLTMEEKVCWFFYFFGLYPPRPEWEGLGGVVGVDARERRAWLNAWRQDEEIKSYVVEQLKGYQKGVKNLSIILDRSLSFIEEV